MSLEERKQDLIDYILIGMEEDEFKRGGKDGALGFKRYDDFVKFQRKIIQNADDAQITVLEYIRDNIISQSMMMDKEYMSCWNTDGFAIHKNRKVVFFHER